MDLSGRRRRRPSCVFRPGKERAGQPLKARLQIPALGSEATKVQQGRPPRSLLQSHLRNRMDLERSWVTTGQGALPLRRTAAFKQRATQSQTCLLEVRTVDFSVGQDNDLQRVCGLLDLSS